MISFTVEGLPKGQPRPRAFYFHGRARVYDPGTAESWKNDIAVAAKAHLPMVPLDGAIKVRLSFVFPRPKAHFKKGELRTNAPQWHVSRPDLDNLAKAVFDCLTVLGFWPDDSKVAHLVVEKHYCAQGQRPGCQVCIDTVSGQ